MYKEIKDEVRKAIEIAREHYPNATIRMPNVELSNRLVKTSGKAIVPHGGWPVVRFSTQIIEDNGLEGFMNRTIYHEVAHIVEYEVFGTMGHGRKFKYIQGVIFGKDNSRCHNYKTRPTQRKGGGAVYRCTGCGKEILLGGVRHKRQQEYKFGSYYRHNCGGGLQLIQK